MFECMCVCEEIVWENDVLLCHHDVWQCVHIALEIAPKLRNRLCIFLFPFFLSLRICLLLFFYRIFAFKFATLLYPTPFYLARLFKTSIWDEMCIYPIQGYAQSRFNSKRLENCGKFKLLEENSGFLLHLNHANMKP